MKNQFKISGAYRWYSNDSKVQFCKLYYKNFCIQNLVEFRSLI